MINKAPQFVSRHVERDGEATAMPYFTIHSDGPAMGFHKVFRYGQSQSATLHFGSRHSEVAFEDGLMIAWVNAFAKVSHIYFYCFAYMFSSDNDSCIFGRVVYGIRELIGHYPGYLLTVYKEFRHLLFGIFYFDVALKSFCQDPGSIDSIVYQFY